MIGSMEKLFSQKKLTRLLLKQLKNEFNKIAFHTKAKPSPKKNSRKAFKVNDSIILSDLYNHFKLEGLRTRFTDRFLGMFCKTSVAF